MQEIDFYLVDAFSDTSFGGNPAAVCPLKEWLPDETLLKMAQQHNQSETAFFVCSKGGIELRWFTTLTEVNLCGHATLAAAHVLFTELDYPDSRIHFDTASGRLTVSREGEWMTLDFPACPTHQETPPPEMLSALGISRYVEARKGRAWLIVLENRQQVEALAPRFSVMTPGEHKVSVTARGEGKYDFVSRFFSPGVSVPEDPVTGSAHTMLIPYWSEKLGKTTMFARQVSARGGDVGCELKGSRVLIKPLAATPQRYVLWKSGCRTKRCSKWRSSITSLRPPFLCAPTAGLSCAGSPRWMKLTCAVTPRLPHLTSFSNTLIIRIPKSPSPRALGIRAAKEVRVGRDYMVVLESQQQVEALTPDIGAMLPLDKMVCVTAPGEEYDFVSRFFCPGEGVPEDPVTGSAHSMLIPYWSEKLGKTSLNARQVSYRGGDLRCELKGDRVLIGGQATLYLKGRIFLR